MASKPPPWLDTIPVKPSEGSGKTPNGLPSLQSVLNKSIDAADSDISLHVISPGGDLILEYKDDASSAEPVCWKVASAALVNKSPYFSALLDPQKFSEGRIFAQQKHDIVNGNDPESVNDQDPGNKFNLPRIRIPSLLVIKMCGSEALGVLLRALCLDTMTEAAAEVFKNSLRTETPSVVAKFIQIADAFNSPAVAFDILKNEYSFGKKVNTRVFPRFDSALLKMKEDRIRQIIMISMFVKEYVISRTMMHTLLLIGSKFWTNGIEIPNGEYLRWRYLPNGVEGTLEHVSGMQAFLTNFYFSRIEELYDRRQYIMHTITDLQAHFLRVYGALEDTRDPKPAPATVRPSLGLAFSTSTPAPNRDFQCRAGLDNASQCDLFQLGQMTRFFAMRAKTMFLGSNILDPDFGLDSENESDGDENERGLSTPPSDIISIITSLKQFPDYQIDQNHGSCGVRRRLLPIIPCIEKYLLDPLAFLGIEFDRWSVQPNDQRWKKRGKRHKVDIRFDRIVKVEFPETRDQAVSTSDSAALLFTAKKRNWEA